MPTFYPHITAEDLIPIQVIISAMANDPLWLERDPCPYEDSLKQRIQEVWFSAKAPVTRVQAAPLAGENKWDSLLGEILTILDDVRTFRPDPTDTDTKDRLAYFKATTVILDKVTSLSERMANVKNINEFIARVMTTFDTIMTPEQRTVALEMLKQ